MSKILHVTYRKSAPDDLKTRLLAIAELMAPDFIDPEKPALKQVNSSAYIISNPSYHLNTEEGSVLIGSLYNKAPAWDQVGTAFPDGSFALIRENESEIEVVSDPAASRTIWYYQNEELFVSASSQLALILFLGSFEFDIEVVSWMLSSGNTGPGLSWDKRFKCLPPDSSVRLNKLNWELSENFAEIAFKPVSSSPEQNKSDLQELLLKSFDGLDLPADMSIPLSGGHDSRAILALAMNNPEYKKHINTITWGIASAADDKDSDAYVAKQLCSLLNIPNKYYHTDLSEENPESVLRRFVFLSEGRIDHISGYADGFELWKNIYEDGIKGIIRGDEGFGWLPVTSDTIVRQQLGLLLCDDYSELRDCEKYGLKQQKLPASYQKKQGETLESWRDRLYHSYRIPTILAALGDIKLNFIEQISPFLSRDVLQFMRQVPDKQRTDKVLFKQAVKDMVPDLPYAKTSSNKSRGSLLKHPGIVRIIKNEIKSAQKQEILPAALLSFVLSNLEARSGEQKSGKSMRAKLRSFIRPLVPKFLKNKIRTTILLRIDPNVLAFRTYMIIEMHRLIQGKLSGLREKMDE